MNTLRGEPHELARELPVATHRDPRLPEALVLDGPLDLARSTAWQDGLCLAQSRAAMLVAHALAPLPGERVLDLSGKRPANGNLAALMRRPRPVVKRWSATRGAPRACGPRPAG